MCIAYNVILRALSPQLVALPFWVRPHLEAARVCQLCATQNPPNKGQPKSPFNIQAGIKAAFERLFRIVWAHLPCQR